MAGRLGASIALVLLMVVASGCADPSRNYVEPVGLTSATVATITGSKVVDPNILLADTRAYLVGIDQKVAQGGMHAWDRRWLIAPGEHLVTFGVSKGPEIWGLADVRLKLDAGKTYVLRTEEPVSISFGRRRSASWIEEEGGRPVSQRIDVELTTRASPMFIPIIVPRR